MDSTAASKAPSPRAVGSAEEPLLEGSPAAARAGASRPGHSWGRAIRTGKGRRKERPQAGEGR